MVKKKFYLLNKIINNEINRLFDRSSFQFNLYKVCVLEIRSYILVAYIMRKVAVCTLMNYRTERHDIKILLHLDGW